MNKGKVFLVGVLAMVVFSGISYAGNAGVFRLPFKFDDECIL